MDVVLEISLILLGIIVGYLISTWPRVNLGNRKRKRDEYYGLYKESYRKYPLSTDEAFEYTITHEPPKGVDKQETYCINFHSTSTQGPPRKSSTTTLEDLLEIALKKENYEYAAKLRDRINKQKNNEDNNSR